jgi:hypothetical protein
VGVGEVVAVGVGVGGDVDPRAGSTTNWTGNLAWPRALVARTLKNVVPAVVGVPDSDAVLGSKLIPAGSGVVGSMLTVGVGLPVTVNENLYGVPTTDVGAVPDTVGGTPTVMALDGADGGLLPSALRAVTVKV